MLKILAVLADELDCIGSVKLANEIDELIRYLAPIVEKEEKDIEQNLTFCPLCEGEGFTEDSPFCEGCRGEGFIPKNASLDKFSFVRRRGNKWVVVSKKGKTLGTYDSKAQALKRLKQIEYFKHK